MTALRANTVKVPRLFIAKVKHWSVENNNVAFLTPANTGGLVKEGEFEKQQQKVGLLTGKLAAVCY